VVNSFEFDLISWIGLDVNCEQPDWIGTISRCIGLGLEKMDYIGIVRIVMERRTFGVRVRVHVRL